MPTHGGGVGGGDAHHIGDMGWSMGRSDPSYGLLPASMNYPNPNGTGSWMYNPRDRVSGLAEKELEREHQAQRTFLRRFPAFKADWPEAVQVAWLETFAKVIEELK